MKSSEEPGHDEPVEVWNGVLRQPARVTSDLPGQPVDVSVVIPTWNRPSLLREAIEALWRQTLAASRFEIIVVDCCSTDGTAEVVRELQGESPCPLRYLRMPLNCGPAPARNMGVRLARCHIIAFTDDNCRAEPAWLANGLAAFTEGVAFVTGTVRYKPEQRIGFFARSSGEVTAEHPTYSASNCFYRREVLGKLGGFDEHLSLANFRNRQVEYSDTDLAWRAKEAGYANRFAAEAIVHHEVDTLTPLNWVLEPFRLFVVPALARRHPLLRRELLCARVFSRPENVAFYVAAVGVFQSAKTGWPRLGLLVPYLAWLLAHSHAACSFRRLARVLPYLGFIVARHAVMCAGLWYGSVRYCSPVLLAANEPRNHHHAGFVVVIMSGVLFPRELLPQWMQYLAAFMPPRTRWMACASRCRSSPDGRVDVTRMDRSP